MRAFAADAGGAGLAPHPVVAFADFGVAFSGLGVAFADPAVAFTDLGVAFSDLGVAFTDLAVAFAGLGAASLLRSSPGNAFQPAPRGWRRRPPIPQGKARLVTR